MQAVSLGWALKSNPRMVPVSKLYLGHNCIGDAGAAALAAHVKVRDRPPPR